MADFVRTLFAVSLTGGIFILAAILVRAGMKHRLPKHFLVLLWAAVLLHLLFISGAPSPTSIYNYVIFRSPVFLGEPAVSERSSPLEGDSAVVSAPDLPTAASGEPESRGVDIYVTAFAVWAAGAAVLFTAFAGGYWLTRRRFSDAFLLKNNPAVNRWLEDRKHPLKVFLSDRTTTPLSYGLFRPIIVLPSGLDLGNAPQLESILEHEYIHGRNRHNVMKTLVYAAAALHWFNPLVWLYWFLFNHDLELACDEQVIRTIGPDRRAEYAHSLVAVAERAATPFPLASAFSARNLKERIVDVMGYKPTTVSLLLAEGLLVAALFALFGTASTASVAAGVPTDLAAEYDAGVLPPELAGWTYPEGADPLATALSLSGGGVVVKRRIDAGKRGTTYEFKILSGDREHRIVLDAGTRSIAKYESRDARKTFAAADFAGFVPMEDAVREAVRHLGGGSVVDCELKRLRSKNFVYEIEIVVDGEKREVEVNAVDGRVRSVESESGSPKKSRKS